RLDLFGHFQAVHAGHLDVGEDDIVFFRLELHQRVKAVLGGDHDVALVGKNAVETLANHRVVIHDQNFAKCTHGNFLRKSGLSEAWPGTAGETDSWLGSRCESASLCNAHRLCSIAALAASITCSGPTGLVR